MLTFLGRGQKFCDGASRRDFLKGSGAAVAATAMATATHESEAANLPANVASAEARDVTLNVNGKSHTLKLEPRVTLLSALRDVRSAIRSGLVDVR